MPGNFFVVHFNIHATSSFNLSKKLLSLLDRLWDGGNEKLSFTMRREFDRHREEAELMKQLKTVSVFSCVAR